MQHEPSARDALTTLGVLAEPTRRRLYDLVVGRAEPVSRDEAATALGIGRPLAAFHLDRLVESGLLEAEYRRLGGRSGPGAGRPAKTYRRARGTLEVSLPRRQYGLAAELFAAALERLEAAPPDALLQAASTYGTDLGAAARGAVEGRPSRRKLREALLTALRDAGFDPEETGAGVVHLRNCPFDALVTRHRGLTCATNMALLQGVRAGIGDVDLVPEPSSVAGYCCVSFRPTG